MNALLVHKLDGLGLYGTLFHFCFAAALFGSAALIFIYLWRKGRLDLDEEPARDMLQDMPPFKEKKNE